LNPIDITRTNILRKRDSQRWEEHTKPRAGWLEKQGLLGSYMSSWSPWSDPTTQRLETTNISYTFAYWIQMMNWNFIFGRGNQFQILTAYSQKIHFNTVLPSTPVGELRCWNTVDDERVENEASYINRVDYNTSTKPLEFKREMLTIPVSRSHFHSLLVYTSVYVTVLQGYLELQLHWILRPWIWEVLDRQLTDFTDKVRSCNDEKHKYLFTFTHLRKITMNIRDMDLEKFLQDILT